MSHFISKTIQYRAMVTGEHQEELICSLSNGAISNDLSDRCQGHNILQRQITRKWYKTELYLQW